MLRKFTYILLYLFASAGIEAQILTGILIDAKSNQPIQDAYIIESKSRVGTVTGEDGRFRIRLKILPAEISFSHISYIDKVQRFTQSDFNNGELEVRIEMELDRVQIEGPVIRPEIKPVVVFQNNLRHVSDFEFIDDHLLVVTYTKTKSFRSQEDYEREILNEAVVYLADIDQNIIDSISLDQGSFSLSRNFRKKPMLRTSNEYIQFDMHDGKLDTLLFESEWYKSLYEPLVDSIGDIFYVSSFNEDFPSFEYYTWDQRDSTYAILKYITDDFGVEMMRSEYKYLSNRDRVRANNISLRTGMDKKIIGAYMRGFQSQTYFETPYAPLFVMNDTIMIFDHYKDHLYKISKWSNIIDSIQVHYHERKRYDDKWVANDAWDGEIYLDEKRNEVWTSFNKNGFTYLKEIKLSDGQTLAERKLSHKYIENLKVRDGFAYYVYRPFESSQKKYLYKEKIYY